MNNTLRKLKWLTWALVVWIVTMGCAACASKPEPKQTPEIIVAAAANLSEAFSELGRQFTTRTGINIRFSFGATADLAKQIENGAPFDVFASADVEHVDRLAQRGLLAPGSRALFARGRLVLWTPEGGKARVSRIEDIADAGVERIAIAKPDVAPYGRATVEALRSLNLWERVESKAVYAQNVTQTKQYAARGEADVAFLPRALVKQGEGTAIEVDERLHRPIDQALGVVRASDKQDAARRFAEFVLSVEGQSVLERYGYVKPAEGVR